MRLRVGAWPGKRAASARIVSLPSTTATSGWLCKRTQPVSCSLWLGVSYNLPPPSGGGSIYSSRSRRSAGPTDSVYTARGKVPSQMFSLSTYARRRRLLNLLWPEGQSICQVGSYARYGAPNLRRYQAVLPSRSSPGVYPAARQNTWRRYGTSDHDP